MLKFDNKAQQTIPTSEVKIIGLGGAGANIIDRIILDGMKGPEVVAMNSDLRTLQLSSAKEKLHLGERVTRGLGCGGDPEIGLKAAQESEEAIRVAVKGYKMIFLCVGLGGGTGSGAAPLISRIAREENAFVVVFATMPFGFEGQRRRKQAEAALNELAVMANALVTFDNGRMAELVLANQGIHEAFQAANYLISESIQAISRIALFPGIIHIGLDDIVSALSSNRSRCLFGSGRAGEEDRVLKALENALNSPLLDKGKLLSDAQSVLVHICGNKSLTMFEVDLMMNELSKSLNSEAQIFFGLSIDESIGDDFSVTLISSLPEEQVTLLEEGAKVVIEEVVPTVAIVADKLGVIDEPEEEKKSLASEEAEQGKVIETGEEGKTEEPESKPKDSEELREVGKEIETSKDSRSTAKSEEEPEMNLNEEPKVDVLIETEEEEKVEPIMVLENEALIERKVDPELQEEESSVEVTASEEEEVAVLRIITPEEEVEDESNISLDDLKGGVEEDSEENKIETILKVIEEPQDEEVVNEEKPNDFLESAKEEEVFEAVVSDEDSEEVEKKEPTISGVKRRFAHLFKKQDSSEREVITELEKDKTSPEGDIFNPLEEADQGELETFPESVPYTDELPKNELAEKIEAKALDTGTLEDLEKQESLLAEKKKAVEALKKTKNVKKPVEPEGDLFGDFSQGELELGGKSKGKFEGETPNFFEGEDLDVPTFLRGKK